MLDFEKACNLINDLPKYTTKHTPEEGKQFLEWLGHPEKDFRILHVAGTNGKGSVCVYMESILNASGIKTGCFVSPHLVDMRERVRIGGELCSKEDFAWAVSEIDELSKKHFYPTFFEFLFFVGLLIFKKAGVEVLILETGLGGRLDATNLPDNKELAIIASIGMDHMEQLGDTIQDIAGEKAGIMRENVPVVFWDDEEERAYADVLHKHAKDVKAIEYALHKDCIGKVIVDNEGIDFCVTYEYDSNIRLKLPTRALYQAKNAALAVCALHIWDKSGCISDTDIIKGLASIEWPGRMEEVLPGIILDGAHNVPATLEFLESVKLDGADKRMLMYGCMRDKQYMEEVSLLVDSGLFSKVVTVPVDYSRAVPAPELATAFREAAISSGTNNTDIVVECALSIDEAINHIAVPYTKNDNWYVYITGSLYLVGAVRGFIDD